MSLYYFQNFKSWRILEIREFIYTEFSSRSRRGCHESSELRLQAGQLVGRRHEFDRFRFASLLIFLIIIYIEFYLSKMKSRVSSIHEWQLINSIHILKRSRLTAIDHRFIRANQNSIAVRKESGNGQIWSINIYIILWYVCMRNHFVPTVSSCCPMNKREMKKCHEL